MREGKPEMSSYFRLEEGLEDWRRDRRRGCM